MNFEHLKESPTRHRFRRHICHRFHSQSRIHSESTCCECLHFRYHYFVRCRNGVARSQSEGCGSDLRASNVPKEGETRVLLGDIWRVKFVSNYSDSFIATDKRVHLQRIRCQLELPTRIRHGVDVAKLQ